MTFSQPYSAHAWGGVQADAYDAKGNPQTSIAPSSAEPVQAPYDGTEIPDEHRCQSISDKTGVQCKAWPKRGEAHCIYHLHRVRKAQEGADDGADS